MLLDVFLVVFCRLWTGNCPQGCHYVTFFPRLNLITRSSSVRSCCRALQSCDVATFVRASGQFPEIAVHEKILDNYIELLSKDLVRDFLLDALTLFWLLKKRKIGQFV